MIDAVRRPDGMPQIHTYRVNFDSTVLVAVNGGATRELTPVELNYLVALSNTAEQAEREHAEFQAAAEATHDDEEAAHQETLELLALREQELSALREQNARLESVLTESVRAEDLEAALRDLSVLREASKGQRTVIQTLREYLVAAQENYTASEAERKNAVGLVQRLTNAAGCPDEESFTRVEKRIRNQYAVILGTHRVITPAGVGPDECGDCGVDIEDACEDATLCPALGRRQEEELTRLRAITRRLAGAVWTRELDTVAAEARAFLDEQPEKP